MFLIENIRNWYGRFERPISSLSLIFGFVFDALTLKRVDTPWENIWILGHILIVGFFIMIIHIQESEPGDEKNPQKRHFWYVNILQFFFGGLLSTYLVFYFRSADISATWPFIGLLLFAFIANESMKRHYTRFIFQVSLFFLSIYSFAIFLVPVLLHKIGDVVFILSGLVSLVFIAIFVKLVFKFSHEKFTESKTSVLFLIIGIFTVINILYFTNLIPPIPLSLKDAGVFHSIQKNNEGNYDITYENQNFRDYFRLYPTYHEVPGSPVYVWSAIFSPTGLNTNIIHEWQKYDEIKKKWTTDATIILPVIGGRDGGFRTYSKRSILSSGKWRVNVKSETGQNIGHVRFEVMIGDNLPVLKMDSR